MALRDLRVCKIRRMLKRRMRKLRKMNLKKNKMKMMMKRKKRVKLMLGRITWHQFSRFIMKVIFKMWLGRLQIQYIMHNLLLKTQVIDHS